RNKNILKILDETEEQFGKFYYVRQDFHIEKRVEPKKENLPKELLGKKVVDIKDYDGIKLICEDQSWLMFRGSGTEPIMRTYAEAKNLRQAKQLLALGKDIVLKDGLSV
ncbi:MAG: phosphoglucomutase/phosphomannomutase family protein, partial [Candidatus Omnitrophica bacterium]|nr:phosphoglucomutase/phosphomannomutase family protein [Candidatus Omnitrophota bacterium]